MDGTIFMQVVLTGDEEQDKVLKQQVSKAVNMMNSAFKELGIDLKAEAKFGTKDDVMSKDEFYSREGAHESDSYMILAKSEDLNAINEKLPDMGWGDTGTFNTNQFVANEGRAASRNDHLAGIAIDQMMEKNESGKWVPKKNHPAQNFPSIAHKISTLAQHESGHPKFRYHPGNTKGDGTKTGEGVAGHVPGTIMQEHPKSNSTYDSFMLDRLKCFHGTIKK